MLTSNAGNNNSIDGGAGNDTASYASATVGVVVDLNDTNPQNTVGAGTDKLISIEYLIGSAKADTLTGDGNDNVIEGGAGNDTLTGGADGSNGDTVSFAGSSKEQ